MSSPKQRPLLHLPSRDGGTTSQLVGTFVLGIWMEIEKNSTTHSSDDCHKELRAVPRLCTGTGAPEDGKRARRRQNGDENVGGNNALSQGFKEASRRKGRCSINMCFICLNFAPALAKELWPETPVGDFIEK